jgi:RimJ/RimL family protein N-acetyltransferase
MVFHGGHRCYHARFMRTVTLRSDVAVGPLLLDHAPNMLAWMNDPDVGANVGLSRVPSLEHTRAWITDALSGTTVWPYAILQTGRHVGNVVFDQPDLHLKSARLSVYVGPPDVRGTGVGVTGMYRALQDVFVTRELHKVWLTVHVRNARAICAYARLGFEVEGLLRDGFLLAGERLAALYMGLLRQDFLALETDVV